MLTQDDLLDDVMLGFRLKEGLDLEALSAKYGATAANTVEAGAAEGLRRGWVVVEDPSQPNRTIGIIADGTQSGDGGGGEVSRSNKRFVGRRLRLSDPDGFLFSNSVISSVFSELERLNRSATKTLH